MKLAIAQINTTVGDLEGNVRRILDSLAYQPVPVSADIGDVAFLLEIGYRTFMLGDQVCLRRETVMEALNLLEEMGSDF